MVCNRVKSLNTHWIELMFAIENRAYGKIEWKKNGQATKEIQNTKQLSNITLHLTQQFNGHNGGEVNSISHGIIIKCMDVGSWENCPFSSSKYPIIELFGAHAVPFSNIPSKVCASNWNFQILCEVFFVFSTYFPMKKTNARKVEHELYSLSEFSFFP